MSNRNDYKQRNKYINYKNGQQEEDKIQTFVKKFLLSPFFENK